MKRLFALLLALVMVFSMVACGAKTENPEGTEAPKEETKGMTESPLAAKEIEKDFEIADDFKIGFICLHDEKSTYDKNFIDAAKEAARFGIAEDRAVNYHADCQGTAVVYEAVSEAVCNVRASRPMSRDWRRCVDEDYLKRGK